MNALEKEVNKTLLDRNRVLGENEKIKAFSDPFPIPFSSTPHNGTRNYSHMNEREKTIVDKRFFQGRTQMEVAEEIGISQAQVSRLEKSAIKNIKRIHNRGKYL